MSKKQGKIQIFERLKNEKISQDLDFMVNGIVITSNIQESDPILRLFFFIATSLKKKNFLCVPQQHIFKTKKIIPLEKNFYSPPPSPIEKYVLPTNQSDRCLEDT